MKRYLRLALFMFLTILIITVTAVAASATTPFSTGGSSYATLEEAVAAVSPGGTVTVTQSVTLTADVTLSRDVAYTIAGSTGNETITFTNASALAGICINAGTVTLKDLKVVALYSNAILLSNSATNVTIESGRYESQGATDKTGCSVAVQAYATLTINNGTFVGAIGPYHGDTPCQPGSYITVNNGTFSQNTTLLGSDQLARLFNANRAGTNLTINGGNFTYVVSDMLNSAAIYINSTTAYVTVNGGTFMGSGSSNYYRALIEKRNGHLTIVDEAHKGVSEPTFTVTGRARLFHSEGSLSVVDTTINGGVFTQLATSDSYQIFFIDHTPAATNTTDFTINGGEFVTYRVSGQAVSICNGNSTSSPVVTITGGAFRACGNNGSAYSTSLVAAEGASLTITGGFFTFTESGVLATPEEIDPTVSVRYTNYADGNTAYVTGYGVKINTSRPVTVSGGTFMGGGSHQAIEFTAACTDAVITGGTFWGHRAVSVYGQLDIVGGSFYANPGQPNAKIIDVRNANAVVNIYGGNFDGTRVAVANISTGAVLHFEKGGTANVYGGEFKLAGTSATGALIGMETDSNGPGRVLLSTGSVTINGITYNGTGARLVKGGAGALIRANANGATVTVEAGELAVTDSADLIKMEKNATVTVNGGTFVAGDLSVIMYIIKGNVQINGGSFTGSGSSLFHITLPKGSGSFEIAGGSFTLNASSATKGGAIIRTGMEVLPQAEGQYYDPTNMYYFSTADIVLSGGVFIDNSATNNQIIDTALGGSAVIVDGAIFLSRYMQAYIVDMNDAVGEDIPLDMHAAICTYNGATYYCYTTAKTADSTMAPVMEAGAAVTITSAYEGIRFTSYIPADVAARLPEGGYTLGTLIAPADYVVAAGGFTHKKLDAWNSTAGVGAAYVDIVAVNSIKANADGSISFGGALISLKQQNYTRNLAAVSYVLVDGVYYYSNYDAADNARAMAHVAKAAYTAVVDIPDTDHMNASLYKSGAFSAFSGEEQRVLQSYSAYTHTWDSATVTPSTNISVGADASANLQAAATALGTALSGLGYSTSGAAILVGNTGDAEIATARSEIEGNGYYIGVINGKIVIVGTTNALTMQALAAFEDICRNGREADGSIILWENISSNVQMVTLNSDTSFVFQHTRDGNIIAPYTGSSRLNADNAYNSGKNHLYNYEDNLEFVDYPVVAAMEIGAALDLTAYNYHYVPDNAMFGEYTIHVGITELAIETLLAGKDVGYYGYAIKDGNIIISSFDDATLRLAKKLFIEDLVDFAVNGTYMIPVGYEFERGYSDGFTGAFHSYSDDATIQAGADYVADELALLLTDFPRPADLQLSGAVNVDSNSLELYYQNATASDYAAYCALLESSGYTAYMAERAVAGNYFVTYYNATTNITLHVMYNAYHYAERETLCTGAPLTDMFTPTLRVIAARVDGSNINLLPESFLSIPATGKLTDTKLTVVQIHDDNFGFCYVYTLEDGTFVVLDGGGGSYNSVDAANLYNVLTELHTEIHGAAPTAQKPIVIAAWYLSHGHGDHYPMMHYFINTYCNVVSNNSYKSLARVNAVIGNFASNDEVYNSMDPNQTLPNRIGTNSWYKSNGEPIPYYKVHTGQQFFIGNLEFEVIYTHEDIHPWGMIYFNNTSTVIRLTAHSTDGHGNMITGSTSISNMALGDLQARGSMVMRATWGDYLKSDIVLSAHHGGNGIEGECYELIDAQIILWSHRAENVDGLWSASSTSAYVRENREWLANTRWYYIFTGRAYEKTLSSDEYYNLTMTITQNGIAGLYAGGDDAFLAGLTNIAGGSADQTLSYGTGQFNGTDYTGGGYLVHRDNFNFEMPEITLPGDIDGDLDEFGGVATIPG